MKSFKSLVVLAVLAASALTHAAESTSTQTVNGTVDESISLSVTSGTTALTLTPGATTTVANTLTINSSNPYVIKASADAHATKDINAVKLFEHDGSDYVESGKIVDSVLQVSGTGVSAAGSDESAIDITEAGVTIFTGAGAVSGGTVTSTVHQTTPWGTSKLASGSTYRMVITYTATTTSI